ncbi:hypothetical protein LDENG_00224880, partial [Lucifuga dentata]
MKKQRLHFLRVLRKNKLEQKLLVASSIEACWRMVSRRSMLGRTVSRCGTPGLSFGQESSPEGHQLCPENHRLPSALPGRCLQLPLPLQSQNHPERIHPPSSHLFDLLTSGRPYRSIKARSTRQFLSSGHKNTKHQQTVISMQYSNLFILFILLSKCNLPLPEDYYFIYIRMDVMCVVVVLLPVYCILNALIRTPNLTVSCTMTIKLSIL